MRPMAADHAALVNQFHPNACLGAMDHLVGIRAAWRRAPS